MIFSLFLIIFFYKAIREEEGNDQREDYARNIQKFMYESTTPMKIPFL